MTQNHPVATLLMELSSDSKLLNAALDSGMFREIRTLTSGGEDSFHHFLLRFRRKTDPDSLRALRRFLEMGPDLTATTKASAGDALDVVLAESSKEVCSLILEFATPAMRGGITTRPSGSYWIRENEVLPWPHALATKGHIHTIQAILEAGIDIRDHRDHQGRTPLFLGGSIAAGMVAEGFDPHATDVKGTPAYLFVMDQMRKGYSPEKGLVEFREAVEKASESNPQPAIQQAFLSLVNPQNRSSYRWNSNPTDEQIDSVPMPAGLPKICDWEITTPKYGKQSGPLAFAMAYIADEQMDTGNFGALIANHGLLPKDKDDQAWALLTLLLLSKRQAELEVSYGAERKRPEKTIRMTQRKQLALEAIMANAPDGDGWMKSPEWIERLGQATQSAIRSSNSVVAGRNLRSAWDTLLYASLDPAQKPKESTQGRYLPVPAFSGSAQQMAPLMAGKTVDEKLDLLISLGRVSSVMVGNPSHTGVFLGEAIAALPHRSGEICLLAAWMARDYEKRETADAALQGLDSIDTSTLSKKEQQLVKRQFEVVDRPLYQEKVMKAMVRPEGRSFRNRM